MASVVPYPVQVEAELDPQLSRWLWLVKWLLAIPHYLVLAFLWMAFGVLSVVAFFAILFTGRYPRAIFDFNSGVLRWSWRVAYYAYGALGTDRYPPFTLAEAPQYPARLEVAYPEQLSRGLVLVKWWLLAIPHYLIVAFLIGGGSILWRSDHWSYGTGGGGLISLLVLIAAIVLAFTGRYPAGLFDLVLGLNRWVLRVAAYAGLMTDAYPPFRLDLGGHERGGTLTLPPSTPGGPSGAAPRAATPPGGGWTAGRVMALVAGALLILVSLGSLGGGAAALWADRSQRDSAGYLTADSTRFTTTSYALTSEGVDLRDGASWLYRNAFGTVRIRATSADPSTPLFVGIAPTAESDRYLQGVAHDSVSDLGNVRTGTTYRSHPGGAPEVLPAGQPFWAATTVGTGTRTLTWRIASGDWAVVVMNADGRAGVDVTADIGATAPALLWVAVGALAFGALLLAAGVTLLVLAVRRASGQPPYPAAVS
ncbi:MAG TPA: DUF4389 domain-containing protein [Actinomycetes bacterium]|nr:DUF4389 domain-containing protein [Actinomycetes bacterium]